MRQSKRSCAKSCAKKCATRTKSKPTTISLKRMGKQERDLRRQLANVEADHWTPEDGKCGLVACRCPDCGHMAARRDLPMACPGCGEWRTFRCPWVGCRNHLYLDVKANGNIRLNFPDIEPWEMEVCCALDVVPYEHTLDEVAEVFNMTRERARQVELEALENFRYSRGSNRLRDFS